MCGERKGLFDFHKTYKHKVYPLIMKRALITGITGQDGSYLSEFLLDQGYEVHGIVRRVALEDEHQRLGRINHIRDKLKLHSGSIESSASLIDIFDRVQPDECYHLAAQSFVHESFKDSSTTFMTNIQGTLNVLSALDSRAKNCRFYFAGSSEMFGQVEEIPQTETKMFHPRSQYGISKVTVFDITRNYRESYGLHASSGILFNHESPRRGSEFVTRKITKGIARIRNNEDNLLVLGNLDATRDWGFAGDYVEAMWLILQQQIPDDYVISTGESHSIREFVDESFSRAGLEYQIEDLHELSVESANEDLEKLRKQKNKVFVVQHPQFYRPCEVHKLLGDSSKAKRVLNWYPKTDFRGLIDMMIDKDLGLNGQQE